MKRFSSQWKFNALDWQWTGIIGVTSAAMIYFGPDVIDRLNSLGGEWAKIAAWVLATLGAAFIRWARNNAQ